MKTGISKTVPYCLVLLIVSASIGCLIAGKAARKDEPVPARLDAAVRAAWTGLEGSGTGCAEYDYFPGGGMRNFYCHLLNFMDYKRFAELVGVPVYIGGPHTSEALVLDSRYSFGRYNPACVARLRTMLIPGEKDSAFRAATQGVYDSSIRPLARVFFVTYRKLMNNSGFLAQEKRAYLDAIRGKTLDRYDYEKYYSFLNCEYPYEGKNLTDFEGPGYDGICDGNVVKTCVAFWIRRSIDGTDGEFFKGLTGLLEAYDSEFIRKFGALRGDTGESTTITH